MNDYPSLFDEPVGPPADEDPRVGGEGDVFALAWEVLGSSPPGETEPESPILRTVRARREEKASALGLVAKWANYRKAKGYVTIHDPATGEWHDLPYRSAPTWAQWETTKRSELYRHTGDYGVFDLNADQMHEIWEEENPRLEEEGIIEEHELPDD